jgi:hypothetical protein
MAEKFSLDGQCLVTGPVLFGVPDHPSLPAPPATVTATPVDSSTVSLVFTESSSNWFDLITEYRIVSNPGGLIWTAAAGSGGTTVSGLSPGISYRFSVSAKNSLGYGSARVSNYAITTPGDGQQVFGGYYGGSISLTQNGVATHYLIVAPKSTGEYPTVTLSGYGSSYIDGPTNTASMSSTSGSAKEFLNLVVNASGGIGGYTDWYIPAAFEHYTLYFVLKPENLTNYEGAGSGSTPYAVYPQPISTPWTAYGLPTQTTADVFKINGSEAFLNTTNDSYWTSTYGGSPGYGVISFFRGGNIGSVPISNSARVRAIRRQPVTY